MLIFENGSYQINPKNPDNNFLADIDCEQPKWVVADNSELAGKILSAACWEAVEDENGNLIDIIPIDVPEHQPTDEEKAEDIRDELAKLENTDNTEKSELN